MSTNKPNPEVLSLLVCDQIITDRITGKQSLIGLFSVVHSIRFPVVHPQISVFASLTGGHGQVPLLIRVVDGSEERPPLVEGRGRVDFKNPLAIANLALQFRGLRFPEPGEYSVQLLCNNVLLREARLRLMKVEPRPGQGPGGQPGPGMGPQGFHPGQGPGPQEFDPGPGFEPGSDWPLQEE